MDFAYAVIYIQPGTVREPLRFTFPRHSAPGANDGNLPYGFAPTGVTLRVTDLTTGEDLEEGTELEPGPARLLVATGPTLDEDAEENPVVDLELSWPETEGQYQLEFRISDGLRTLPRDFRLVLCAER